MHFEMRLYRSLRHGSMLHVEPIIVYLERCSHFVKAIDTRLKEIKLARTAIEEASESMLVDLKDRKKNKRPINDRDKRKTQEKLKDPREKSRIISKRKLKDEFPELQEVEDKFFEIVKKEKQKYIEDEDSDLSSVKITRSVKKITSRKIDKNSHLTTHEAKEIETKTPPKKISKENREKYPRKTEISATETVRDIEQKKVMAEEVLPALAEAIVESPVKKISKRKRRKKLRKKRPMHIAFRLPRPCKIGVCKPDICCRRTFGKIRIRPTDRAIKDHEKWDKVDVSVRTLIEKKEKMRQKSRKSWTKLMRVYKRKELTKKYDKERISLQEMMAMPEELAVIMEDVKKAKREIQETGRARTARTKIRKPAKETWKSRAVVAKKSRDTSRRSEKGVRDKEVTSMPESFLAVEKARKVRRVAVTVDPCVPWEPSSLAKDLQMFLAGPLPESTEKKERPGIVDSKKIDISRSGLYPRISDFHSTE